MEATIFIAIGIILGIFAASTISEPLVYRDYTDECFRIVDGGFPGLSQQTRYDLVMTCLRVMKEDKNKMEKK